VTWPRAVVAFALVALAASAADARPWAWLGVRIRDLSEQEMEEIAARHGIREGFGVVVVEIIKEAPAQASGLRVGDLVVAVRDLPVVDTRALQRFIAGSGVGEVVPLTVLRRDEGRRGLTVRLGRMPDNVAAERVAAEFGFVLREPAEPSEAGGPGPSALPSVSAVLPKSRAHRAGLQAGDVLLEVNGRPMLTLEAVREALLAASPEGALPVVVRREGERLPVLIEETREP